MTEYDSIIVVVQITQFTIMIRRPRASATRLFLHHRRILLLQIYCHHLWIISSHLAPLFARKCPIGNLYVSHIDCYTHFGRPRRVWSCCGSLTTDHLQRQAGGKEI